ncbi:MAG: hypothetical protein R2706_06380 [Acidimicrobiales bacterium]
MTFSSIARRLLFGTTVALLALWLAVPASLQSAAEEEIAQRGALSVTEPEVLGVWVEGLAFRITSDQAQSAALIVDRGDGPQLVTVDLPYLDQIDNDARSISVAATSAEGGKLRCSIERNNSILDQAEDYGSVECSKRFLPTSASPRADEAKNN